MKTLLYIGILACLILPCKSQDFAIKYNYIDIDIPAKPVNMIKHGKYFYGYFSTDNDRFSTMNNYYFYIIDEKGNVLSNVIFPEKLKNPLIDLYVKNDTIFTSDFYNHSTFYLDLNQNIWVETKPQKDIYYEDEFYTIYSKDFGEWGGATWFKNKKKNLQYNIPVKTSIINKLNNSYYLTTPNAIIKIEDPEKLTASNVPYELNKDLLRNYVHQRVNSNKGMEEIFKYKKKDFFLPTSGLITSFINNDHLYHLFKDSTSIKIVTIKDKKLIDNDTLFTYTEPVYLNSLSRQTNPIKPVQSIWFHKYKEQVFGVISIHENKIEVDYFKNQSKEKVYSQKEMNDWFAEFFKYYYKNFQELSLEETMGIESQMKARDISQNRMIYNNLLNNKELHFPKIYRKIEDEKLRLLTTYYSTIKENKIELINFEWGYLRSLEDYEDAVYYLLNPNKKQFIKNKFNWIFNYLTKELGKPNINNKTEKEIKLEWVKDSVSIVLKYSFHELNVSIYKN